MTKYDIRIFAEIVDASALTVEAILERARGYAKAGADVIDLGCLPDTPFPHLEDAIAALKAEGYKVSVDSADRRRAQARRQGRRRFSPEPQRIHPRHRR